MIKRAVVFNLGCKVNQYECDLLISGLVEAGYEVCGSLTYADLYIVNTCAVTAEAERKSRQILNRIRRLNPNAKIMIIGCASQKSYDFYLKNNIKYVGGTADKLKVLENIDKEIILDNTLPKAYEESHIKLLKNRTRAFVKIEDGCDNFCSYCIIPILRGRVRSRKIDDIVNEIQLLSQNTKEIVFTGINLSSFGKDTGESLFELFNRIKDIDIRVRLGSFYQEAIDNKLLDSLFSLKKFCPHFHLSLQNGDDKVLKDMNRHYTTEDYYQKVNLIRNYDKNAALTTDIIVGYPTETDENFKNTIEFCKKVAFSDIHIFPFSKRENTAAYKLNALNADIIKKRRLDLEEVRRELRHEYLLKMQNITQNVLKEEFNDGLSSGYSEYYLRLYYKNKSNKEEIKIKPTEIYLDGLKGEEIDE